MSGPIRALIVFGTRPEAIKMAPVLTQLQLRPTEFAPVVCVTAQHREMLDQALGVFGIKPDFDLDLMTDNQSLAGLSGRALMALDETMREVEPKLVLVQGDTSTAVVAALAAFYRQIPVAHIEAGLRTGLRYSPFPEEMNRKMITVLASCHFAPTEQARQALLSEGVSEKDIFVTGNTVIDAVQFIAKSDPGGRDGGKGLVPQAQRLILVTAHRREHFGGPLEEICLGLGQIVESYRDVRVVYPVHLNPNVRNAVHRLLDGHDRIQLTPPVPYRDFVALLLRAHVVLTDSGGVQEEAAALSKPVLVMRESTERREGVAAGVAKLVGVSSRAIVAGVSQLLDDSAEYARMTCAPNPYGDGHASERIAEILTARFIER